MSLHCDWLECAGGHTFVLQKSPFHDAYFILNVDAFTLLLCVVCTCKAIYLLRAQCNAVPHQKSFLLKSFCLRHHHLWREISTLNVNCLLGNYNVPLSLLFSFSFLCNFTLAYTRKFNFFYMCG